MLKLPIGCASAARASISVARKEIVNANTTLEIICVIKCSTSMIKAAIFHQLRPGWSIERGVLVLRYFIENRLKARIYRKCTLQHRSREIIAAKRRVDHSRM